MRIEKVIYEYDVKIFDVGEVVRTITSRCPLDHPANYTVIKFHKSFGYGDPSCVDVTDKDGNIDYGVSTEYLTSLVEE